MKGTCCICRKSIGARRPMAKQVVASFTLSHFGLCPTCLGRTRADIARIYGQSAAAPGAVTAVAATAEKGLGA